MNALLVILAILLVLTSPIWIIGIYVTAKLHLEWRRCPICKGDEAVILLPPQVRKEMRVCGFHERRLQMITAKETEVLGGYPDITLD